MTLGSERLIVYVLGSATTNRSVSLFYSLPMSCLRRILRHAARDKKNIANDVHVSRIFFAKIVKNLGKRPKKVLKIWIYRKNFIYLQRERRSQVEPRCAERWHGWRVKPTEMMSNSTLPLGFLHSNTELVTCGQLFIFYDTWAA